MADTTNYNMGTVNLPTTTIPPVPVVPGSPDVSTNANIADINNPLKLKGNLQPPTVPVPSTAGVTTYAQLAQQALTNAQNQVAPQEQAYTSIIDQYKQAQNATEGKNAYTQSISTDQGLQGKTQAVQDIINQITAQDASNKQVQIGYGTNVGGVTASSQQAFNAEAERANTVKQLGLGASLAAAQGNLAIAQNFVDKAVAAKYDDAEKKLTNLKDYLTINQKELERLDKKAYDQQTTLLNGKIKDLEAQKKTFEEAQKMVIDAAPFAPANVTAKAQKIIQDGGSQLQVAQALGKYGGDYMGNLVKQSAIAENYAQIAKINAEIKASQTPLPNNALPGTNSSFYTTLANSAVNKGSLDASERQAVTKNLSVIDQLGSLQANIEKQNKTGFFKGNVNNFIAAIGQNADVGTINAQLQAIVPNLARGVYGEVGVLTDNDIANYRKTLPTLTAPKDQNDAVLALTLKAVQNNLKNTLTTAANSKMDVSRFIPQYNEVTRKINDINDRIGVNDAKVSDIVAKNPQAKAMVESLVKQGVPGSQILEALGAD